MSALSKIWFWCQRGIDVDPAADSLHVGWTRRAALLTLLRRSTLCNSRKKVKFKLLHTPRLEDLSPWSGPWSPTWCGRQLWLWTLILRQASQQLRSTLKIHSLSTTASTLSIWSIRRAVRAALEKKWLICSKNLSRSMRICTIRGSISTQSVKIWNTKTWAD